MFRISFLPLILLVTLLTLAGCAPSPVENEGKTIILVRHAEKCTEPSDNPGLTSLGEERASELVRTLMDFPVEAIYSTPFDRTRETVRPLSEASGVDIVETPIQSGFLEALAETIRTSAHRMVVVSGHSNTTPRMVNLLAGTDLEDLEETEYDRLYIVNLSASGVATVTVLRYGPRSGPSETAC